MAKHAHGEGTIYQRGDGRWAGQINMAPQGATAKRKTVYGKTKSEVLRKLGEARRAREAGDHATTSPRFGIWLDQWLERATIKPKTRAAYRSLIEQHLKPTLGGVRITQIGADHVYALHKAMSDCSPTTIRNAHRCASSALSAAMREERITKNLFRVIPAPAKAKNQSPALTSAQIADFRRAIAGTPHESRWLTAIFLALRQGENLGVTWDHVNLADGILDIAWQLQRIPYIHGCDKTRPCGRTRAASCPFRRLDVRPDFEYRTLEGNLCLQRPKTDGSVRIVPIPRPVLTLLRAERERYDLMRKAKGYHDHGLVWHRGNGRPIPPRDDYDEWQQILAGIDVPARTIHAARHTAATALGDEGVPENIIQAILGHSDAATTRGYQNVDLTLMRNAVDKISGELES